MKKIIKLLAVIVLLESAVYLWAQDYKTHEVSNAPAFTAIEVSGGDIDVFFSQGENHAFSISGPAKLVKATKIKVKENTLFINYNSPLFTGDDDDLKVYVSAPQINRITVSGEADFESKNGFQGQDLTVKTHQNGEVSMKNVSVNQINIDAKGSSSVDFDYVQAGKIRISSSDRAEVEISGQTGQMEVVKKGMFAEIDTKELNITNPAGANGANDGVSQVAKDGGVEFVF